MSKKIIIHLEYDEEKQLLNLAAPLDRRAMCLGVLDIAKDAVLNLAHEPKPAAAPLIKPAGPVNVGVH